MIRPLDPTDRFIDNLCYTDPCTVYERADGTVYKIKASYYTGIKSVVEFANRQAWACYKFGKAYDPEGKGHKGGMNVGK